MKTYAAFTKNQIAVAAVFIFSVWCAADVITIGAVKDTTLYEHTTGNLGNGAGSHLFTGKTANGDIRRGLIMFDVASSLPARINITNVVLTLTMSKTIIGAQSISLHHCLSEWGEGASDADGDEGKGITAMPGDATWLHTFHTNGFWTNIGGDYDQTPSASTSVTGIGNYSWSTPRMGMEVQAWLDNGAFNFGWLIKGNEDASTTAKRFDTRENTTAANRPALQIAYIVPEPGLCLVPPAVVLLLRRRRNAGKKT